MSQVARESGREEALGKDFQGRLAMWQVISAGDRSGIKAVGGETGAGTCSW